MNSFCYIRNEKSVYSFVPGLYLLIDQSHSEMNEILLEVLRYLLKVVLCLLTL